MWDVKIERSEVLITNTNDSASRPFSIDRIWIGEDNGNLIPQYTIPLIFSGGVVTVKYKFSVTGKVLGLAYTTYFKTIKNFKWV